MILIFMPIERQIEFPVISREEFKEVDYILTGIAFEAHRVLGRLADEDVYKRDIFERARAVGLQAHREVRLQMLWRSFSKCLIIDLVVGGAVYEAKTAESIVAAHEAQTRNYLILAGVSFGKILNFRQASVQRRFVTHFADSQQSVTIMWNKTGFMAVSNVCCLLPGLLGEIIQEFGPQLTTSIYTEALCGELSPQLSNPAQVPVSRDGMAIGSQRLNLITPDVALRITSFGSGRKSFEPQLRRLVSHTPLKAIQWIDITREAVVMTTIINHSAK
jgi:GxxExxY protein